MAMTTSPHQDTTDLLLAWRSGNTLAFDELMKRVYGELRRLAHHFMDHERPGGVLQTTALVNEAYLRLIDSSRVQWESRAHFLAVTAQLMRRVLVDAARERQSQKRGGDWIPVSVESIEVSNGPSADLIALEDALHALASVDKRKSEVVTMRFFGGLSVEETAAVLNVSTDTVMRDWHFAKVWLYRELCGTKNDA
jgi:RNA polymerase sigma factor (TIGR02999 family)